MLNKWPLAFSKSNSSYADRFFPEESSASTIVILCGVALLPESKHLEANSALLINTILYIIN